MSGKSFHICSDAIIISVKGGHATRYLHNRLSNDIKSLKPGTSLVAAALTAQGKVEALGFCSCINNSEYLFTTFGGKAADIIATLAQYKVTEQIEFKHCVDKQLLYIFGGQSGLDNCLTIGKNLSIYPGELIVVENTRAENIIDSLQQSGFTKLTPETFYQKRFINNSPIFPNEIDNTIILSETGISEAISFNKGCYVGQEVIAKIDALGKPPRLITRLKGGILTSPTDKVLTTAGIQIGAILSSCKMEDSNEHLAFAIIRSSSVDVNFIIQGHDFSRITDYN